MLKKLKGTYLVDEYSHPKAHLYRLEAPELKNKYYVVSSSSTRRLLNSPEVVGFENYDCMCNPTKATLEFFKNNRVLDSANILTILRGGTNYPLEECCYRVGIPVNDISYLSFKHRETREEKIEIKYNKLDVKPNSTLMIGNVIATGDTVSTCMEHVINEYNKNNASLKNLIVFTIGSNMAIDMLERLNHEMQEIWYDFEGIYVVFYEGIFGIYKDMGITGLNIPYVDFSWKDSILAPEYRAQTLCGDDALFERCIIYNGGARRYDISDHYDDVVYYWTKLEKASGSFNWEDFIDEKLGSALPNSIEEWIRINHYSKLHKVVIESLFRQEMEFRQEAMYQSAKEVASWRKLKFQRAVGRYSKSEG